MASEKRILIREIKPECKFRAIHETTAGGHSWIDYLCCNPSIIHTNRKCDDKRLEKCKYKELEGLSYQESIRKMCDAYFKAKDKGAMESERVVAALNALLEGK